MHFAKDVLAHTVRSFPSVEVTSAIHSSESALTQSASQVEERRPICAAQAGQLFI